MDRLHGNTTPPYTRNSSVYELGLLQSSTETERQSSLGLMVKGNTETNLPIHKYHLDALKVVSHYLYKGSQMTKE